VSGGTWSPTSEYHLCQHRVRDVSSTVLKRCEKLVVPDNLVICWPEFSWNLCLGVLEFLSRNGHSLAPYFTIVGLGIHDLASHMGENNKWNEV
jgi:hypothetical protein